MDKSKKINELLRKIERSRRIIKKYQLGIADNESKIIKYKDELDSLISNDERLEATRDILNSLKAKNAATVRTV